jgi:endonuclease YncB( thermonuclease family)
MASAGVAGSNPALSWRIGSDARRSVVNRAIDRYRRIVAVCFKGTEDLDRWMVASGWAVAYGRYSLDYVADEDAARQNIWSGDFDMPWD